MKRTLQVFLALALVSIFLAQPAMAASNEGLDWGVAADDELTYRFVIDDPENEMTLDEGVNITITATPALPSDVNVWSDIPDVSADIVYTNGTAVGLELLVILGIMYAGGHIVVPVGNFTHLGVLAQAESWWTENTTLINSSSEWGTRFTASEDDESILVRTTYLKSDGMLARYQLEITNTTSGVKYGASLIRDGLGFDFMGWIQDNLLIVGIGVGVIVLLGAVVCVKRR
jgi:hypothetical protein